MNDVSTHRRSPISIRMVCQILDRLGAQAAGPGMRRARRGSLPALLEHESARDGRAVRAQVLPHLAVELDDETPGAVLTPAAPGTLKFLCPGMLDAANLRVALHRSAGFRLVRDLR